MKTVVIIQARMGSTRLPGKVMLPLCGAPVLSILFRRLAPFRERITLATTDDGTEAPIVDLCRKEGIAVYRGSADDVLSRYYHAAKNVGAQAGDAIVRITSDCPLIDPEIIGRCIETFRAERCDYLSNVFPRTFPRGMDTEVFTFAALEQAYHEAVQPHEREHVTPFIHTTHRERFLLGSVRDDEDRSRYRLTLDEEDDYRMIVETYKLMGCATDFDYPALIRALESHPEIAEINAHVEQKKI